MEEIAGHSIIREYSRLVSGIGVWHWNHLIPLSSLKKQREWSTQNILTTCRTIFLSWSHPPNPRIHTARNCPGAVGIPNGDSSTWNDPEYWVMVQVPADSDQWPPPDTSGQRQDFLGPSPRHGQQGAKLSVSFTQPRPLPQRLPTTASARPTEEVWRGGGGSVKIQFSSTSLCSKERKLCSKPDVGVCINNC